jgi:hypothetical protein
VLKEKDNFENFATGRIFKQNFARIPRKKTDFLDENFPRSPVIF